MPGLVDLSEFAAEADSVARIVLESIQELLLKLALQMARDDYETRRERQRQGVKLAKVAGKYAGRIPDAAAHHRVARRRSVDQAYRQSGRVQRKPSEADMGNSPQTGARRLSVSRRPLLKAHQ